MSTKYKFIEDSSPYFVSFATENWVDVFVREDYFKIIIDALKFCRELKGMNIFAYCIMPSHIHLIFSAKNNNPGKILAEFKGYTSKILLKEIQGNIQESRKNWLIKSFILPNSKNLSKFKSFWQAESHPQILNSNLIFLQKLNYIHENPVKAGFVFETWHWKYSSARNFQKNCEFVLEIDEI